MFDEENSGLITETLIGLAIIFGAAIAAIGFAILFSAIGAVFGALVS